MCKEWNLHSIKQIMWHKRLFPSFSNSPSFLLSAWGESQLLQHEPGAPGLGGESWCWESAFAQLWNHEEWVTLFVTACPGLTLKELWKNSAPMSSLRDCAAPLCLRLTNKLRNPCGMPEGEVTCKWAHLWQHQRVVMTILYVPSGVA